MAFILSNKLPEYLYLVFLILSCFIFMVVFALHSQKFTGKPRINPWKGFLFFVCVPVVLSLSRCKAPLHNFELNGTNFLLQCTPPCRGARQWGRGSSQAWRAWTCPYPLISSLYLWYASKDLTAHQDAPAPWLWVTGVCTHVRKAALKEHY